MESSCSINIVTLWDIIKLLQLRFPLSQQVVQPVAWVQMSLLLVVLSWWFPKCFQHRTHTYFPSLEYLQCHSTVKSHMENGRRLNLLSMAAITLSLMLQCPKELVQTLSSKMWYLFTWKYFYRLNWRIWSQIFAQCPPNFNWKMKMFSQL